MERRPCREPRYLHVFSRRTNLRREVYEKVAAEWTALGLDGEPPRLPSFRSSAANLGWKLAAVCQGWGGPASRG